MKETITLSVFEIVGSHLCVASDDGEKVHELIAATLRERRSATVSFLHVSSLTAAFLNAAIGQLYGTFSEERIRAKLRVKDMQPDDLALLKRVVDTAKQYFKDPKRFNRAVQEAIEDRGDARKR